MQQLQQTKPRKRLQKNKGKGKAGKSKSTYDNFIFQPQQDTGKAQQKVKAKEPTSYATAVGDQETHPTNAGGKDQHTTSTNQLQYGHYQTTLRCNDNNNFLNSQQPRQLSYHNL
eukprot:2385393-Amphidinium_carterae.2